LNDDEFHSDIELNVREDWYTTRVANISKRVSRKRRNRHAIRLRAQMPSVDEDENDDEKDSFVSSITSMPEMVSITQSFKDVLDKAPDFWTAIRNHDVFKYDEIVGYVEGVLQLVTILTDDNLTTKTAIASIMLYAKSLIGRKKSLMMTVSEYIEAVFITAQGPDEPEFITVLTECRQNWQMFKKNKLFKKFSNLLTLLVSLGFCEATSLEFSIGGLKLVESATLDVQMNAFDVTDAILDTAAFFIEGGYRCYKASSLKPLLYDDYRVHSLEDEFIALSRMWDLQQNGNLYKMEKIQASEFDNRLEKCISSFKKMLPAFSGLDKKIISDKYNKLLQIKSDYVLTRLAGGTRRSPWTVELFGDSSQGKSTVGDYLIDGMLMAADLSTEKVRRAVLNASSKFMDTWKTDTLVAILDDMCNEKSSFVEKPPTRWVIDLCNNQTFYAPKAEIEAKGKVFVEPEIVIINTNKKDLDAYTYSNCPYSIQRRPHIVATVRAKSIFQTVIDGVECGLSSEKVKTYYETHDQPVVEDLWDIDVEVAVKPSGKLDQTATYSPFIYKGKKMTNISMLEFLEMNIDLFQRHRERQFEIVDKTQNSAKMEKCGIDKCCNVKGLCSIHSDYKSLSTSTKRSRRRRRPVKLDPHIGEHIAAAIHNGITTAKGNVTTELNALDKLATKGLYIAASYFVSHWDWLKLVPAPMLKMSLTKRIMKHYAKDTIVKRTNEAIWLTFILTSLLSALVLYTSPTYYPFLIILWSFVLSSTSFLYKTIETWVLDDITKRTQIMYPILERFKNENYKYVLGFSTVAFSIMAIRCVYKSYMAIQPAQGEIAKPTEETIAARDKEQNPYCEVQRRPLPIVGKGRTVTSSNMSDILSNNLLYGAVDWGTNLAGEPLSVKVNALMVDTNYMILPKHYFKRGDTHMTCCRNNPSSLGGTYRVRLDLSNTIDIPNSDLKVVYVAEGGSYKNITEYLIDDFPEGHAFNMKYRQSDGTFLEARGVSKKEFLNNGSVFDGLIYYNLTEKTFGGLCGAVLYSASKGCNITGIHVGGTEGTTTGCASIPRRSQVLAAIDVLSNRLTCIKTASDGDFPTTQYETTFLTNEKLHPKSPVNFLPHGSTIQYHGTCIGKITSHSDAKVTLISETVTDVTGVPNKWTGPQMKPEWKGWQDCLEGMSKPGESMPYDLIEHSARDYLEPLLEIIESQHFWKEMRPLTDEENLMGIPGKKFMDAIKKGTSIGFPLNGPKSQFLEILEATEEYPHYVKFTDKIMREIRKAEERYSMGLRAYPIAKACKKDEILAKQKCRIFFGNSITLTWLIRKYFLPIIRFLQMHPLVSECAVGINCHSKEWDQLYHHVKKFDKLFGGDYKKYDQKLPSQLIITAFNILISIAKHCDYTKEDIAVMEAMVADIVYAYIAINGDLVSLTSGTHISGNSLTVIVNGICGSLNLRAAFYAHNPWNMKFRDNVALMTYGDDNLGSKSDNCNFSIVLASQFLGKYGQTYTMPNKTSELSEYLESEDFEFLKRSTVYIPEIDCHVGALQLDSIYKSLHMYLRGKQCENSEEEACALNLDTAMRELFNHGRKVYEEQRVLLNEIADRHNLTGFCTELNVPFDNRVLLWKEKYDSESVPPSSGMTLKDPPRMTHGVSEAVEDVPIIEDTV
jgi:hypothetical protein